LRLTAERSAFPMNMNRGGKLEETADAAMRIPLKPLWPVHRVQGFRLILFLPFQSALMRCSLFRN
jgi:hypothetical protein